MSNTCCEERSNLSIPADFNMTEVAADIETLTNQRMDALASGGAFRMPSPLEQTIDEMLNAFSDYRRLKHLAEHIARGGHISVEADRTLIAANETTYLKLLSEAVEQVPGANPIDTLIPAYPTPID